MKLYRVLMVKVYTIDRAVLNSYQKFHTFCDLSFNSSQGRFNISFKEDRRSKTRDKVRFNRSVYSYLVELEGPGFLDKDTNSVLYNKVIVVVMFHVHKVNYEVLARLLLELYLGQFGCKIAKLAC